MIVNKQTVLFAVGQERTRPKYVTGISQTIGIYVTSTGYYLTETKFMFLDPKYLCELEIYLCLCIRKSICVCVCTVKILWFLSFRDLTTPLEQETIYSGFRSKNIGWKKVFW